MILTGCCKLYESNSHDRIRFRGTAIITKLRSAVGQCCNEHRFWSRVEGCSNKALAGSVTFDVPHHNGTLLWTITIIINALALNYLVE